MFAVVGAFAGTATWTYSTATGKSLTDQYFGDADQWTRTPDGTYLQVGDDFVLDSSTITRKGSANVSPGYNNPAGLNFDVRSWTVCGNTDKNSRMNVGFHWSGGGKTCWLPLTIGADGITWVPAEDPATWDASTQTCYFPNVGNTTIWIADNQTWKIDRGGWKRTDYSSFAVNLASTNDVLLKIGGRHHVWWQDRPTTNYLGRVTFNNMNEFLGPSRFNQFGTNAVTMTCEEIDGVKGTPGLQFRYLGTDPGGLTEFKPALTFVATDPTVHNCNGSKIGVALSVMHDAGEDAWIRFAKPFTGTVCKGGLYFCGGARNYYNDTGRVRNNAQNRRFGSGYILDQDNSGLVAAAGGAEIDVQAMMILGHANALGTGNALPVRFSDGDVWGTGPRIRGLVATNNVKVAANLTSASDGGTGTGGNNNFGMKPFVYLGAAAGSTNEFSGRVFITGANNGYGTEGRLTAGKGGVARFTGEFIGYGPIVVDGEGDVVMTNLNNKIANFSTIGVRSGQLVALNGPQAVGNRIVEVGDDVPGETTVRAMIGGRLADETVKFTPFGVVDEQVTFKTTVYTFKACAGYTVNKMPVVDGVTLQPGDKVLVNSPDYLYGNGGAGTGGSNGPQANGVYEVGQDGLTLTAVAPFTGGGVPYGYRIHVTEGDKYGGKAFYVASRPEYYSDRYGVYRPGDRFTLAIFDEAKDQPDVGFLIGAISFNQQVNVRNNLSTGRSELGAYEAGNATFSSYVTIYKDELVVSAVKDATLSFGSIVSNAAGVATTIIKEGPGTVSIGDWKRYLDGGLVLRGGTLSITGTFFHGKTEYDFEMSGGETGMIQTTGVLDFNGRTINLKGFGRQKENKRIVLIRTETGSLPAIVGTPTVTGLDNPNWSVSVVGKEVIATYKKPGVAIIVK